MYKQVILVRQDLQLPKGKLGAQAAHAAVGGGDDLFAVAREGTGDEGASQVDGQAAGIDGEEVVHLSAFLLAALIGGC